MNVIVNRGATDVSKLKIGAIEDDKPVTMTIKLPAIYHDLRVYAEVLEQEGGHTIDLNSFVAPMLARFIATDRAVSTSATAISK